MSKCEIRNSAAQKIEWRFLTSLGSVRNDSGGRERREGAAGCAFPCTTCRAPYKTRQKNGPASARSPSLKKNRLRRLPTLLASQEAERIHIYEHGGLRDFFCATIGQRTGKQLREDGALRRLQ